LVDFAMAEKRCLINSLWWTPLPPNGIDKK
jgi:hypothetical protein